ncbi:hypothetical protein HWQ46_09780 [Shewanella sp. D64]|uniref:hypothetical protein n=1 Tax=unclassified Shewanella TaxID=196818 RepID=UPI0022BA4CE3|nr:MULTISPECIES: hypothetical protein [unclassified Shewanella]MEC4725832.1 hypothetical protein [Shewanella sp. D64]MEC4737561.1 hypothetical protein [Shewanella sp. E94]WBJ93379.1 hypothetical protein HWQ47_15705 [Shewanella sp. MTB7]
MTNPYSSIAPEFAPLREQALADIRELAPNSWTDLSVSDPGITILEQLIVKFQQLAEKINLPLTDLLVSDGDVAGSSDTVALNFVKPVSLKPQFFSANEVLTTAAVSLNDRRRLILDHPLVANVLVEPVRLLDRTLYWDDHQKRYTFDELVSDVQVTLPGRYRALVELVENHGLDVEQKKTLSSRLLSRLKSQRNLCEQWQEVILLEPEFIKLNGGISLRQGADVEQTLIDIHRAISDYINPPLKAQSLEQLVKKGRTSGDIYQGPILENGYFDEIDLNQLQLRNELRVSDIIRIILDFEAVQHVFSLQISNFANPRDDDWRDWVLPISSGRVARLEPILSVDDIDPNAPPKVTGFIDCYKNNAVCPIDSALVISRLEVLEAQRASQKVQQKWRDIPLPTGERQDLSYQSVQQEFPVVYGLGENILPNSVGTERLARVKQLQGYLMLFDQLIANYHQQLADSGALLGSKARPQTSYQAGQFSAQDQALLTADDYWQQINTLVQSELTNNLTEQHTERENRLLDHLFSRLGESFSDQSLLGFSFASESFRSYLDRKYLCLQQLARLGHDRLLGRNYLPQEGSGIDEGAGLERRLQAKLGLDGNNPDEPLPILVEHSLLYPNSDSEIPAPYHSGKLFAQLRKDGYFYPVVEASSHGLLSGDIVSLFDFPGDQESVYAGAYSITRIDADHFEMALDLGLNPDSDAINTEFTLKWMRGRQIQNPYAMQVSLVFQGDKARYQQAGFRLGVETLARAETPAHITLHVRWLDEDQQAVFDSVHQQWLQSYTAFLTDPAGESELELALRDKSANELLAFLL